MVPSIDVSHYDDQNFNDLCEEVLVGHFVSLFHRLVDEVPDPGHFCPSTSLLREECLDKLSNELLVENRVELLLVICALEGNRHEGEFKHVILRLIATGACLNLSESGLKDLNFTLIRSLVRNLNGAKSHEGL